MGGGGVVVGWIIQTYGPVWGLDAKVAIVLAWVVALAVALGLSALLKPKSKRETETPPAELTPARETPTVIISPTISPVFNNAPNIDQRPINYSQAQSQSQDKIVTQNTPVSPEIECVDCYFLQTTLSQTNELIEGGNTRCMVALSDFYLTPLVGTDPWVEIKTHLVFYASSGNQLRRVPSGVWKQGKRRRAEMRAGETETLVIAIIIPALDGSIAFTTYEYFEEASPRPRFLMDGRILHHFVVPRLSPLREDSLLVKVTLVGTFRGNLTLHKEFWFRLEQKQELVIAQIPEPHFETDLT
jgi:hypothetical protein